MDIRFPLKLETDIAHSHGSHLVADGAIESWRSRR
jgi:hypothetical protein